MGLLNGHIRTVRYRLVDGNYIKQSEWTNSNDVEMDDGTNLEDTMTHAQTRMSLLESNVALLNQNITEIKVVSSLPSDASSNSTTAYFVI